MTTKISYINKQGKIENEQILKGTRTHPECAGLTANSITRAAVFDHGDFAIFEYSGSDRYSPAIHFKSIVLDEQHPKLDLAKEESIYIETHINQIEYTGKGSKEKE